MGWKDSPLSPSNFRWLLKHLLYTKWGFIMHRIRSSIVFFFFFSCSKASFLFLCTSADAASFCYHFSCRLKCVIKFFFWVKFPVSTTRSYVRSHCLDLDLVLTYFSGKTVLRDRQRCLSTWLGGWPDLENRTLLFYTYRVFVYFTISVPIFTRIRKSNDAIIMNSSLYICLQL